MNREIIKNNKKLSDSMKPLFKQAGAEVVFFNRPFVVFDYIIHVSLFRLINDVYFMVFPDFIICDQYSDLPLDQFECVFLDLPNHICAFTYVLIENQKAILSSHETSLTEKELLGAFKYELMTYREGLEKEFEE